MADEWISLNVKKCSGDRQLIVNSRTLTVESQAAIIRARSLIHASLLDRDGMRQAEGQAPE